MHALHALHALQAALKQPCGAAEHDLEEHHLHLHGEPHDAVAYAALRCLRHGLQLGSLLGACARS